MRLRKTIKKIAALATGATMMGATLMGAMAADLADYPAPFIQNGAFSGVMVIGDKAAAEDVVGVSDIAVSLQFAATKTTGTTAGTESVVTGDVFRISASGDELNILEPLSDVKSVIDSNNLDALKSGSVTNDKGSYSYDQYLTLGNSTVMFSTAGDGGESIDVDDPQLYLKVKQDGNSSNLADGSEVFLYKLTFPTALKSDVDSSCDLDDLDNKKITMLGKEYTIINTEFTDATHKLTIDMMGGAITDTLEEGESKTYTINGVNYEVRVDTITDVTPFKVKFTINSEVTDALQAAETFTLEDKTQIGIKEILPNEAGDVSGDVVTFYLGAKKVSIADSNGSANNEGDLTIGSNDIGVANGDLIFTNTSGGCGTADISLSSIQIAWQSDDNYYIPIGGKASETISDADVLDLLETLNIDFEFAGMKPSNTDTIKIIPSGSSNLKLTMTLKGGDTLSTDFWYYNNTAEIILGKSATRLIRNCEFTDANEVSKCDPDLNVGLISNMANSSKVLDEQYFIVETNKYSHLLQLKKIDTGDSTITLKDTATGDSDTISYDSSGATFYKDGYEYTLDVGSSEINLTKIAGDSTDKGFTSQAVPGTSTTTDYIADLWTEFGAKVRVFDNATIILEEPINGHEGSPEAHNILDVDHINITFDTSSDKTRVATIKTSSPIYNDLNGGADPTITLDSDSDKAEGYTTSNRNHRKR